MQRRSFITGLVSLVAAPAIVRAGSLMPVRSMVGTYVPPLSGRAIALLMEEARLAGRARWITYNEALELFTMSEAIA